MTEATTQYEQIEGTLEDGVHAYKGVIFAKSPSVAAYSKNRTTMIFGTDNRIEEDPAAASREVWDLIDTAL